MEMTVRSRNRRVAAIAAAVISLIAVARVVSTYGVFNHTIDEPTHISCGLEWLQKHSYTYEFQHPPLSRVLVAVGPWLLGTDNISSKDALPSKNPLVLYNSRSYEATLSTARAGNLPFLLLACFVVFVWARDLYGGRSAVIAVLLLTTLPAVLGHSALATTDASLMATLPWSLFALRRLLLQPTKWRALHFGIALAAGILSKFSFFPFFVVTAVVVFAAFLRARSFRDLPKWNIWLLAVAACFLVVWGGYRWSLAPLLLTERPGDLLTIVPAGVSESLKQLNGIRVPLTEIYLGIAEVRDHNQGGHLTYLLGETGFAGWWYFFPVVFFFKTPISFLLLCAAAPLVLRELRWRGAVPAICALLLLLVVMPSRINLGIRHVLPIYPLLAIPIAGGIGYLLSTQRYYLRFIAGGLLAMCVVEPAVSHPDYMAYFNAFAGDSPEQVRVDSDLDWGQNAQRLAKELRDRGVTAPVGLGLFGSVDPSRHGLRWYPLSPWESSSGWVAVSATELKLSSAITHTQPSRRPWRWLDQHTPVSRVGNSILLYFIPRPAESTKPVP